MILNVCTDNRMLLLIIGPTECGYGHNKMTVSFEMDDAVSDAISSYANYEAAIDIHDVCMARFIKSDKCMHDSIIKNIGEKFGMWAI